MRKLVSPHNFISNRKKNLVDKRIKKEKEENSGSSSTIIFRKSDFNFVEFLPVE